MRIRGVLLAIAVDVGLGEGIATEDVVDAPKGGSAVGGVACQVVGSSDDLDAVEDVACVGCQWVGLGWKEKIRTVATPWVCCDHDISWLIGLHLHVLLGAG